MNITLLVTGGAGFVGSNLAILFKQDYPNARVIAFDNLKRRGSELNLSRLKTAGVEFTHGDIRNREDIDSIGKFDLMIECSAEPSVLAGYNDSPLYLLNTNLLGTINCLEAVRKWQADILFLSTSRVYPIKTISEVTFDESDTRFVLQNNQSVEGVSAEGISERFPLTGSRSLYGTTKLTSELIIQEYIDMYGIRGVINRCGILTGPWQMGKVDQGVIVLWIAKHIFKGTLSYIGYNGTGKQVRDVLHVKDLYRLLKIQLKAMQKHNGQIYNVGGGKKTCLSLCELTSLCEEITGNKIKITPITENRTADIPIYISDCAKVSQATGWSPTVTVREIVQEITDWIRDNDAQLKPILS